MMRSRDAAASVGNGDPDVLHHALILVIEDVAVEHEVADVALVARADGDGVMAGGPCAKFFTSSVSFHTPFSPGYCGSITGCRDLWKLSTAPGALTSVVPSGAMILTTWNGLTWMWKGWLARFDFSVHSSTPPSFRVRSIRLPS